MWQELFCVSDPSETYLQAKLVKSIVGEELEAADNTLVSILTVNITEDDSLHWLGCVWMAEVLSLVIAYDGLEQHHSKHKNVQLKNKHGNRSVFTSGQSAQRIQ